MLKDIKFKPYDAKLLMVLATALSIFITFTYARSMTLLYGVIEIALVVLSYALVLRNIKAPDQIIISIVAILTFISLINGVIYGDVKSVFLLSISIVLPLAISVLPIGFDDNSADFKWGFLVGLAIILLNSITNFLGHINSNTLGFYCYMAISFGFVWYKQSKKKIFPLILILLGAVLSANTGSRNVAIIVVLMLIFLLLPDKFWENKATFRIIYIAILFYTIFALDILEWIFSHEKLASFLNDYTSNISDKNWGMEGRIHFFKEMEYKISQMNWYNKLLGEGILKRHGHNMFYQSVFIYGYLGTVLIYAMYIRVFEMAYSLIKKHHDKIALGAFVALIGVFLLNGADLFLLGSETCAVIPQVLIGVIMLRYRNAAKEEKLELEMVKE